MDMIYRGYNETRGWIYGLFSSNWKAGQKPSIIVSMLTGYPKEEVLEVDPESVCKCVGVIARESCRGSSMADRMIFTSDILKYKDLEQELYISYEDYTGRALPVLLEKDGIYKPNETAESQFVVRTADQKVILFSEDELKNVVITGTRYETELLYKTNALPATCGECRFYSPGSAVFDHYDDLDGWDVYYREIKCAANGMTIANIREEGSFSYDYGEGDRTSKSRPDNCPLAQKKCSCSLREQ